MLVRSPVVIFVALNNVRYSFWNLRRPHLRCSTDVYAEEYSSQQASETRSIWNYVPWSIVSLALIISLGHECTDITIIGSAAVASIVKASYLGSYGLTGDFLWDSVNLTIWTAAECNVGILAGSIPSLKPLFKAILQSSSYAQGYGTSRRQPHASKGYTLQRSTTGKTKSGKTQSQGSITGRAGGQDHFEMYTSTLGKASGGALVSAGARKGITAGSNSSEESILALQGPRTGGIMKTTQVEVTTMSPSKGPDDDQWKSIKEVI